MIYKVTFMDENNNVRLVNVFAMSKQEVKQQLWTLYGYTIRIVDMMRQNDYVMTH